MIRSQPIFHVYENSRMINISKRVSHREETNVYLYLPCSVFMDKSPRDPPLLQTAAAIQKLVEKKMFSKPWRYASTASVPLQGSDAGAMSVSYWYAVTETLRKMRNSMQTAFREFQKCLHWSGTADREISWGNTGDHSQQVIFLLRNDFQPCSGPVKGRQNRSNYLWPQ